MVEVSGPAKPPNGALAAVSGHGGLAAEKDLQGHTGKDHLHAARTSKSE